MIYCYPRLGRAGLGNCLLPWARAVIFARNNSCPVLAPNWVQPRIGGLIRREKKKRFYFFQFSNAGYVKGLAKYRILLMAKRRPEEPAGAGFTTSGNGRQTTVIVFEGLKNYFADILGHHELIGRELRRIVNRPILERADAVQEPFIAVNMRRGDLTNLGWSMERLMSEPRFTPTEWFLAAIAAIKEDARWRHLPIKVVSDGTDAELEPVLEKAGCQLVSTNSAAGDILMMSRAKLLVASGYSTFSMWASYLGVMPTLYYPGKMQEKVFPAKCPVFEGEWQEGQVLPGPQTT